MTLPGYRYDVAFSFLSADLALARDLAGRLEPSLAVFVYERHKEDLLGGDGMERFALVFKTETRLAVILHREGWGHTPWTAFEENHIRSKALESRMTSFMLVSLDKAEHPVWVPVSHLYASIETESRDEITAIIRARAREQGAVLRRDTATEFALRQKRAADRSRLREERARSYAAIAEVREEMHRFFNEVGRIVSEIKAADPAIQIDFGSSTGECGIAGASRSVSIAWVQPVANSLRGAHLRVNYWDSRIRVPAPGASAAGHNWRRAVAYAPHLSDAEEWVWRYEPTADDNGPLLILGAHDDETSSSLALADQLVRHLFDE